MEKEITDEMIYYLRLRIMDIPSSPFYQLFTDDDLKLIIKSTGYNMRKSIINAAMSAAMVLSAWNTREISGQEQIWNDLGKNYLKVLDKLTNDSLTMNIDGGIVPYAAGVSWEDIINYELNPDTVQKELFHISPCDKEHIEKLRLSIVKDRRNGC